MEKKQQINIWYVVGAILAITLIQDWWARTARIETIPYSEFEQDLKDGLIAKIEVSDRIIHGTYRTPHKNRTEFFTTRVEPDLADHLSQSGIEYTGVVQSTWLRDLLSWILPTLLFFGLWLFVIRKFAAKQGFGGLMSIGKSRAKVYVVKDTKVTFEDVAGVDEAKAELEEIVEFLKNPRDYGHLGARIPKGILLVGPPGTGKTLLARAVAGEAGVPFYSISGSEFVEMFVGVGAARVRDLFEQARTTAPAIIFIDELDALGRARGAFPGMGGHDEREQTLNQLLSELDGFDPSSGLVLLAATNRPEILDPALLRAGRFDRQVLVDRPDKIGRCQILEIYLQKLNTLAEDVKAENIAALTPGFSGADLANLVNEAALLATRRKGDSVTMADFTSAVERIVAGLEKRNRLLNPLERTVVANHEMGHALVALSLPGADPVHKISIIPRGIGALGYTIQRPTEDRFLMTRNELEDKIAVLLGGRASELLIFDRVSTGAADDLARATDIARSMVLRYGMDSTLGHMALEEERRDFLTPDGISRAQQFPVSEQTAREIDIAVRGIIHECFERASAILSRNKEVLIRCASALLEKETLNESELRDLTGDLKSEPRPVNPLQGEGARQISAATGD